MAAGTCQYCGCTEGNACSTGCAWTDQTQEECTACETTAHAAVALLDLLMRLPRVGVPVDTAFAGLTLEDRRKVVMTVRGMSEALLEQHGEELAAMTELIKLNDYLAEHHPSSWNPAVGETGTSPVDVAITLLTAASERRIVLVK